MVDWIGGTIGNYRIEEPLGTGGMGRVYRAVHVHINRTVALKVLHDQHSSNTTFQARFLREAQSAAALKHANIVDVIDFNDHRGVYYLVMEFVPDGSLRSLLQQQVSQGRTLPLGLGLDLIRQAAEGLHYAHQHGMVHRDIKPDNLLLQRDAGSGRYVLKIADFGLAQLDTGNTLTLEGQTMGTPAYMSPEQCQGVELDSRSDIYSLGIVLYEVLTGMVPFDSRSLSEAVYKHVYAEPPSPQEVRPDLSPALSAIVLRCLRKDPNERFATAGELAGALRALGPSPTAAAAATVPATPPGLTDQLQVHVDQAHLIVTPGQPTDLTITLSNTGSVPLRATVNIDGVPKQWISTPPSNVELAPGASVSGPVRVRVPLEAASEPASYDVTVSASAAGNPTARGEAQARLSVQPSQPFVVVPAGALTQHSSPSFSSGSLSLAPGVAGARRSAEYDLTLYNSDSVSRTITPQARSDDPTLHIAINPPMATVDPGQTTTVKLNVVAPPRWFGRGRARSFQVGGGGDGLPPVRGQFVQQPFFPFWMLAVIALALVTSGAVVAANLLGGEDNEPGVVVDGTPTQQASVGDPTSTSASDDPSATPGAETATVGGDEPTPTEGAAVGESTPTEGASATEATATDVVADATATESTSPTETPVDSEPTATEETPVEVADLIAFAAGRNLDDPQGQLDIYVMDADGSNQRPLISELDDDWLPAWSPDGSQIVWVSRQHGNHQLYIANADGSGIRRLTTSDGDDLHPSWSSDNRHVLFMRLDGDEELFVINVFNGDILQLTDNTAYDGYAVWSPDGQQVAWSSNRDGQNEIYARAVFVGGAQPVRLTNNPSFDYNPVWSPDGSRIGWLSDREGSFDLHMMFADGTSQTRWTSTDEDDINPAWSPDGSAIAYVRKFGDEGHVFVLQDGIEFPIAANASPNDPGIKWSPDGTRIAYVSEETGDYEIWLAFVDGSEPLRLTDHEFNDANVSWFPSEG